MKQWWKVLVCCLFTGWVLGAWTTSDARPLPKGERLLGIAINYTEHVDFAQALTEAKRAGMQVLSMPFKWDEIEVNPGQFAPDPNFLAIANTYYPDARIKVALELNPIDTNRLRVPEYLVKKPFDHPEMIAGFKRIMDYVVSQIPDLELVSLTLGNEVDGLLHTPEQREAYLRFIQAVVPYAKQKFENVPIGVKATYGAHLGEPGAWLRRLNSELDVVMVTYYHLEPDFSAKDPARLMGEMQKLVDTYPKRTLFLSEMGMPSGRVVGSSEEKQAEFIEQTFRVWDRFSETIALIEFTWLHDQSEASMSRYLAYYNFSSKKFLGFLSTLGLRTQTGKDKPAFRALVREAKARGW